MMMVIMMIMMIMMINMMILIIMIMIMIMMVVMTIMIIIMMVMVLMINGMIMIMMIMMMFVMMIFMTDNHWNDGDDEGLYGCECWTVSPPMQDKLETVEMWFCRRMIKMPFVDCESKQAVEQKGS